MSDATKICGLTELQHCGATAHVVAACPVWCPDIDAYLIAITHLTPILNIGEVYALPSWIMDLGTIDEGDLVITLGGSVYLHPQHTGDDMPRAHAIAHAIRSSLHRRLTRKRDGQSTEIALLCGNKWYEQRD